jgi:hypothetical protein
MTVDVTVKLFTLRCRVCGRCHHVSDDVIEIVTGGEQKVPANLVPAAAVIREGRALFGMIGRKEHVDGRCAFAVTSQGFTLSGRVEALSGGSQRSMEFLEER